MPLQYLAARSSSQRAFDAGESQTALIQTPSYLSIQPSRSFPQGYTQVTDPQKAWEIGRLPDDLRVENRDRRLTCPRASRALWPSHCWPSRPHAAAATQVTSKNSWSLTRFRLPLSQYSLASTTKPVVTRSGQASAPVPTPSRRLSEKEAA